MTRQTSTDDLLADLLHRGVVPIVAAGRLRLDAPPGALDPALRDRLVDELPALRRLVASLWRPREHCLSTPPCRLMSCCRRAQQDPAALRALGMTVCGIPAICTICRSPLPDDRWYLCDDCGGRRQPGPAVADRGGR